MPDISTQTQFGSEYDSGSGVFEQFQETSCPLKYEEEVILRPENYRPKCACCSENTTTIETNNYEIIFDFRPKLKYIYKGIEREQLECFIDLCDQHYKEIKDDNYGKLPVLIGNDLWDAIDGLSNYSN